MGQRIGIVACGVALACSCGASAFRVADTSPVTSALVAKYTDKKCVFFIQDGARDAPDDQCGPFPCGSNGCVVSKCGPGAPCFEGFCSGGYCRRAEWTGGHECPKRGVHEAEDMDYSDWSGCSCRRVADENIGGLGCDSFPCTPNGCYVHACSGDADCALGYCASHTGQPHGYCVISDAH